MKSTIFILLIYPVMLLFACSGKTENMDNDIEKVKKILEEKEETTKESTVDAAKKELGKPLTDYVVDDYSILDTVFGDLNKDEIKDCILVLKSKNEKNSDFRDEINRPLIILIGEGKNKYTFVGRNDRVVYCKACGGVFGDPYDQVVIKNGYFSVEHYGGSNWRWTRIITFKYDEKKKNWFLHRDGGDSFHTSNPEDTKTEVKTTKDFGVVSFENFNNF